MYETARDYRGGICLCIRSIWSESQHFSRKYPYIKGRVGNLKPRPYPKNVCFFIILDHLATFWGVNINQLR